jgi:hypothetical protein
MQPDNFLREGWVRRTQLEDNAARIRTITSSSVIDLFVIVVVAIRFAESHRPSLHENYSKRGQRLAGLCFYEYASQIFVQTSAAVAGRTVCFRFENTHPQHATHVQVSANSSEALTAPSLCGSFTRFQDPDNSVLPNTSRT